MKTATDATDYLSWLSACTPTAWWHDSADPGEQDEALKRGAVGVTTNPVLTFLALRANAALWSEEIARAVRGAADPRTKAESLMRIVVTHAARKLRPIYDRTSGENGYVCAQLDPSLAADRTGMYEMGRRFSAWAPNVAVKLPVTTAGLDVLEKLCAEGVTVTATVSFSVAQVMAVGERYQKVLDGRGSKPRQGRCFAVMMIGRLDDYLRDVVHDAGADITENDLQQAGLATAKRACRIYRERGFQARLMIAGFRQTHQVAALSGADVVLSVHPKYQKLMLQKPFPLEQRIGQDIAPDVVDRLSGQKEFLRAFQPDGLAPGEFISFGPTQRTLTLFVESGWNLLESFVPAS